MASVSVSLLHGDTVPVVEVQTLSSEGYEGQQFIVIRLGEDATVLGPGVDRTAAAYARALGQALIAAADTIETSTLTATA